MRIENNEDWIEIEFVCYATDSVCRSTNLTNEKNCVEIDLNFDITGVGWGCVGCEYFTTYDIQALSNGFQKILFNQLDEFTYSGDFPYQSLTLNPFYTFFVKREESVIKVRLKIHDRLDDYIFVEQLMPISCFENIAKELLETTEKFPIRE